MPDTAGPRTAADLFTELLCADPAWVREEFDAIVAANFLSPPADPRVHRHGVSWPVTPRRAHRLGAPAAPTRGALVPCGRWARQRSPPLRGAVR